MRFLFLLLLWASSLAAAPLNLTVQAESAILYNPDNGAILYEKNAYTPQYPASITKIPVALYALKMKGDQLNQTIAASQEAVGTMTEEAKRRANYKVPSWYLVPGATHMGIKKGEILSLQDLLYGMFVVSADDGANVAAELVSGSIPAFMEEMNAYIKTLGCKKSFFTNPSGLFHPDQKTTAYDMALMMKEGLKNPTFRKIISTVNYLRPKTNKQDEVPLLQTNKLIRPGPFFYPKALGGKTGHLALARNTIVMAAKDQDRTLIAVLLKVNERNDLWRDATKLFEAAFNQPKVERVFLKAGVQKYSKEDPQFETPLTTYTTEDALLTYYPAEEPRVKGLLFWNQTVTPPIKKGDLVAELRLVDAKGQVLKTLPLYANNDVQGTLEFRFKSFFRSPFSWVIAIFGVLSLLYFLTRSRSLRIRR